MKKGYAIAENQLLAQARAGNPDAFSELVRLNSSSVYGISLKILKNREDAEDNLQNVFCKAYRKIRNFNGESRVSTWLFRIAINEALMQLRRRQSDREICYSEATANEGDAGAVPEAEDSHANPERECIATDLTQKAFRGCNPTMAAIFVRNKAEGWTNRELARIYGTSPQTVKSRVFRTRMRLRRQMVALSHGASAALGT
ncbi:MAG TPA: sigma-70 family RNA polymerase sigma factor [Candidatus Sulfotelmatobacter sp.]|jgi:RNA polymerase sigma-70 factor (ECF subfamily)|nr:sigma-70 family RNA polymerase sigma factor [Candidatus Sulfotelmatobacter sp.]